MCVQFRTDRSPQRRPDSQLLKPSPRALISPKALGGWPSRLKENGMPEALQLRIMQRGSGWYWEVLQRTTAK